MPAERADAARNRRRVLDAAAELFAARDPQQVTMEELARAAGIGKATLYRRYPDRTAIATALLDEHERVLQDRLLTGPPPLGPGAPPAERLAAFTDAYVGFLERHGHLLQAIETDEQRLTTGAYAAWRQHVAILLQQAGAPDGLTGPLADQILAALAPGVYRHQRRVLQLEQAEIAAAARHLATAVTSFRPSR